MLKNTSFRLLSQITKGKFFLRPELALSLGPQLSHLLAGNEAGGAFSAKEERSLEIICIHEDGKIQAMLSDQGDPNDNLSQIYDEAPEGSIAMIPVKNTLLKYGTMCDYGTVELAGFIMQAAMHNNIGSIVLDFDSGGGAVDAVAPLTQAIRQVRAMGKPVVASIDMACSAAYWAASECDYLVADNDVSAEVGSIGVVASFMDVRPYYEKEGIKFHRIYATESDQKNLPFEMALEGKYELIREEMLDPLARAFQAAVQSNRAGKLDLSAKGLLNGKTYYAEQAKALGLIDRVGNRNTAFEVAMAMTHARKFS